MERASVMPGGAKTYGEKACTEQGLDFAETFAGQFVLSETPVAVPPGWVRTRIGGWHLASAPDLPVTRIISDDETARGVVIGLAVSGDGALLGGSVTVGGDDPTLERWVLGLAGRYTVILTSGAGPGVYPDPCNSLVTFYNAGTRRVGTSIPLIIDDTPDLRHPDAQMPKGEWLLFGDTMDRRVTRMLSNHRLNLDTFETRRVWPRDDTPIDPPEDYAAHLDGMVARQAQILAALLHGRRVVMPITGGLDSRFLFACLREQRAAVAAYYVHVQNKSSFMDSLVATAVCERAGVPLTTMSLKSPQTPRDDALDRIMRMIRLSGSFQMSVEPHVTAAACLPRGLGDTLFRGGIVELTHSNKWTKAVGDSASIPVEPAVGMRSLSHPFPMDDGFVARSADRYAAWLDGLPAHLRGRAIDFAHCELWTPTTNHVFYNAMPMPFMVNPFSDRQLILDSARMSYRFRVNRRPQNYVLRTFAPDLKGVPYATPKLREAVESIGLDRALGRRWR